MDNQQFYTNLPLQELPVNKILGKSELFKPIPSDWEVIVTDIKGSTQAVKDGKHALVNLVATGSIIAALNLARKLSCSIPFFFGGDGATLLTPPQLVAPLMLALQEHQANTLANFELDLRVGSLPVAAVYEEKHKLMISKASMSPLYSIPVILGEGLKFAETTVKAMNPLSITGKIKGADTLDLEGMECRWNKIKPPQNSFEVVCLLVEARDENRQAEIFKKVLDHIEQIYGSLQKRQPISISKLRLEPSLSKINAELKVKLGKTPLKTLLLNWLQTLYGRVYFTFDEGGKQYLDSLVKLSDTLVMDGRINTVMSGSEQQRTALTQALAKIEQSGDIFFGIYASEESVMSCYVRDRKDQHIHFVDGSGGGYTQAANMLKAKLKGNLP